MAGQFAITCPHLRIVLNFMGAKLESMRIVGELGINRI